MGAEPFQECEWEQEWVVSGQDLCVNMYLKGIWMTDCVSNVHMVAGHVHNGSDVSCPTGLECLNKGQRNYAVSESSGDGGGCPTDCVCRNGARTGRAGHVRSRWGHAQRVPEAGRQWVQGLW